VLLYSAGDDFPAFSEITVTTADGREWFCSRRYIKSTHNDKTYIAIQQRRQEAAH
jgi:hypothetical protein